MNTRAATAGQLEIGDVVFIRIDNPLYRKVSDATKSWTSHVGVIVDATPGQETVAESTFPVSKITPLAKFLARSEGGKCSIRRLKNGLTDEQQETVRAEAVKRLNLFYHTGFNFDSKRQFCSKFVYEVLRAATGIEIGAVETLEQVLAKNKATSKSFWRLWYFGFIPWTRRTISPASQYESPRLFTVCESL